MGRKPAPMFSEKTLKKGEIRKLNALKKSLGDDIAIRAFGEWYSVRKSAAGDTDKNAAVIADALQPLIARNKLRIPRGGYVVRRGRGRVIVERPRAD